MSGSGLPLKIALLCAGLGHIRRGHEVFARELFSLLRSDLDITLFKGGGDDAPAEVVVDNISRLSPLLDGVHVAVSPRWADAAREQECQRIEAETFAYASLKPLMEGAYDVVHCLEQEVCNIVFEQRHLFRRPPKVLFANGGGIPATFLPHCDAVQEHSAYNLARSDRRRAFLIPHGVDSQRFSPRDDSRFRQQHGIPAGAPLALSVGLIGHHHKRMDHVIRELAPLDGVHLAIVGQSGPETPQIELLAQSLMPGRVVFASMAHADLWQAYAAADAFVLGSLYETFGIVYIEAQMMGLPVFCTDHPNQRSIVRHGVFVDMARPGALRAAFAARDPAYMAKLGREGREWALAQYDLQHLKGEYIRHYRRLAEAPSTLPTYGWREAARAHAHNAWRAARRRLSLLSR